jgi:hypothetical protein
MTEPRDGLPAVAGASACFCACQRIVGRRPGLRVRRGEVIHMPSKYLLGCSVLRMVRVHDEETRAMRVRLDYGVVAFGVRVHDGMDPFATRRG